MPASTTIPVWLVAAVLAGLAPACAHALEALLQRRLRRRGPAEVEPLSLRPCIELEELPALRFGLDALRDDLHPELARE
ncbi:MAG TPA: hypothetical protein VE987_15480, partial [Polyangiaceae bacterium]|nr:hypothetical protein [Polyangiaceae bacterium]